MHDILCISCYIMPCNISYIIMLQMEPTSILWARNCFIKAHFLLLEIRIWASQTALSFQNHMILCHLSFHIILWIEPTCILCDTNWFIKAHLLEIHIWASQTALSFQDLISVIEPENNFCMVIQGHEDSAHQMPVVIQWVGFAWAV